MRESGWDECIEFSTSLKVTPDAERALSLRNASAARAFALIEELIGLNCH
jgi:hypothetical protein